MTTTSSTPSLSGALTSLRTSTSLLSSSISILSTGTSDLPRLAKVLAQTRHFELLPASTLHAAQLALVDEIAPEVARLLERVEHEVERLERKEASLRARWALQEGRLGRESAEEAAAAAAASTSRGTGAGGQSRLVVGAKEEMKAQQVRSKKDRLSYAVERLQMQALQTERKLRQSMAVQERAEAEDRAKGEGKGEDEEEIEF